LEVGGRPGSEIDDHIEDPATRSPHDLRLFIRQSLEMIDVSKCSALGWHPKIDLTQLNAGGNAIK
jgi:hypothetical protein